MEKCLAILIRGYFLLIYLINVLTYPRWSNVTNMLFIDNPTQVGFSYSIPVNAYVDSSTSSIITLPDAICPDYADEGTCGTYSYANESLTANSTISEFPSLGWRRRFAVRRCTDFHSPQMLHPISGKRFKVSWVFFHNILARVSPSPQSHMEDSTCPPHFSLLMHGFLLSP